MLFSTLLTLAGLVSFCTAGYVLQDDYSPTAFFGMFDFFTGADPTNGFVTYVDQTTAQSGGLISMDNGTAFIGVDSTNVASGSGRQSVRLVSQSTYNHGLIVLDVAHMPGGVCGTWPAFWTVGPNWPNEGEIDIIEGVNSQTTNDMTLHTSSGCSITNTDVLFAGTIKTPDCNVDSTSQAVNAGCGIAATNTATFGNGFNAIGGGVYATEWTSDAISIWFFPRSSIPSDIGSGSPNPSGWGTPSAVFQGGCDIDSKIQNQQIVFDTTFCGDWAGAVWTTDAVCSSKAATCQDFVQNNPEAFADAFWTVNSLKVYQSDGTVASATSSIAPANATTVVSSKTTSTKAVSVTPGTTAKSNSTITTSPLQASSSNAVTSATGVAQSVLGTTPTPTATSLVTSFRHGRPTNSRRGEPAPSPSTTSIMLMNQMLPPVPDESPLAVGQGDLAKKDVGDRHDRHLARHVRQHHRHMVAAVM